MPKKSGCDCVRIKRRVLSFFEILFYYGIKEFIQAKMKKKHCRHYGNVGWWYGTHIKTRHFCFTCFTDIDKGEVMLPQKEEYCYTEPRYF